MKSPFFNNLTWIAIIGILLVSIIPNIYAEYWLSDIFANFKVQFLIIAVLLLIISWFILNLKKIASIFLLFSIAWNSYYIVPLYFGSNDSRISHENTIKISSVNLLSSNTQVDLVQDFIQEEDPDILILMEVTPEWQERLTPILNNYTYIKMLPRPDNFGIAMLSKQEMRCNTEYFDLNDKPSLIAEIFINNKPLTIVATHPVPPVNQFTFLNRNQQLKNILKSQPRFSKNLVIIGDLNTSSFSNHFRKLTNGNLKDSRDGFGILPTWPADFKFLQTTLDHCLVSEHLQILERTTGKNTGSDHLPISVVIGIE